MAMGNLPPFEEREAYGGFFPALLRTWTDACFRPSDFFNLVGNSQNLAPALLFGVLVGWVGSFIGQLWSAMFQLPLLPFMRQEGMAAGLVGAASGLVCVGLFGWVLVLAGIFIGGLLFHLFLLLFGGANQGLNMTLRVIAYAQAPALLAAVPFVGGCIGGIWSLVLYIIGLASAHRTDVWRAALAVLVPIVLCVCVGGFFAATFLTAAFQQVKGMPGP